LPGPLFVAGLFASSEPHLPNRARRITWPAGLTANRTNLTAYWDLLIL
jgi:hypothetical protein